MARGRSQKMSLPLKVLKVLTLPPEGGISLPPPPPHKIPIPSMVHEAARDAYLSGYKDGFRDGLQEGSGRKAKPTRGRARASRTRTKPKE